MVNTDKLRGIMAERGVSMKEVAAEIGIHYNTFYEHMNRGVFGSDEIEAMIDFLDISDPLPIFFEKQVT